MAQFTDVSFNDEALDATKLAQMMGNDRYLFENSPRVFYKAHGINRGQGLKIVAGIATVPITRRNWVQVDVYFGSVFSVGCRPTVVQSITSKWQAKLHVISRGLGNTPWPDHRGMNFLVASNESTPANDIIQHTTPIAWIAVGW